MLFGSSKFGEYFFQKFEFFLNSPVELGLGNCDRQRVCNCFQNFHLVGSRKPPVCTGEQVSEPISLSEYGYCCVVAVCKFDMGAFPRRCGITGGGFI